jgi:hypothetical protein
VTGWGGDSQKMIASEMEEVSIMDQRELMMSVVAEKNLDSFDRSRIASFRIETSHNFDLEMLPIWSVIW